MAFVLKQSGSTYFWPVRIDVPADGGRFKRETFEVEFESIAQSELEKLTQQAAEETIKNIDFARRVVVGWREIIDDEGNEMPFSTSSFEQILDVPMVAGAIASAYFESVAGRQAKN